MLVLFAAMISLPLAGIVQTIFWPDAFAAYGSPLGRVTLLIVFTVYGAVILFIYWARFQTMSPITMVLATVKMCYVCTFVAFMSPLALFGLTKLKINILDTINIDFGDATLSAALALVVSMVALEINSNKYINLCRPENSRWARRAPPLH